MGPSSYTWSVVDRNVVMWRVTVLTIPGQHMQCVRKVAVHLVQLKRDGTRWRTGGEVRKVAARL